MAPLKRVIPGGEDVGWEGFHDREVVAPLKLHSPEEANILNYRFHDREVVAPLKRVYGGARMNRRLMIPRPRGRGPIEASHPGWRRRGLGRFHDREVVAPLKLGCSRGPEREVTRFHDREVVAPLKLALPLTFCGAGRDSTTARSWPH